MLFQDFEVQGWQNRWQNQGVTFQKMKFCTGDALDFRDTSFSAAQLKEKSWDQVKKITDCTVKEANNVFSSLFFPAIWGVKLHPGNLAAEMDDEALTYLKLRIHNGQRGKNNFCE